MRVKNLPHSGLLVRHYYLEPLELSIAGGAKVVGVTRQAMNTLISDKASISAKMAIRLEKAFGCGAKTRLRMQTAEDLAQAERRTR